MRFMLDGLEVFFPYPAVYREQFAYMMELKRALDAKGDGILEMPTGTGKTVSLLALITSYQFAHPDCGKLVYCTRTVPEMTKTMEELKRVINYRASELAKDREIAAASVGEVSKPTNSGEILAICLSSRRNLCIHEDVIEESDREKVDAACRSMTASWVRQRAEKDSSVKLCDYFEQYDKAGTDADLKGIYDLDDLKALGQTRRWCPYFLARHVISYANVVVYNYQYMLDPKIASMVSKELEDKSIIVFDEAHNIDNVCIEALSVTLDRRLIDGAVRNLTLLGTEVKRMKSADAGRLQEEYTRLLTGLTAGGGLGARMAADATATASAATASATAGSGSTSGSAGVGGGRRGGEELAGPPVIPADLLEEAVPGNIRNAELFVRFMKHVVRYLRDKIKVASVLSETPSKFLHDMATALSIDTKPLKFAYSRLNSLMRTLQITDVDDFTPIQLVADFATLLATYPVGFMIITEPYNSKTPHIPDPIMQLACLDASLAVKPVFQKFQSVILTSGTLSPIDMYPKMLNFNPVVRLSLEMSIVRPCICPMVISKGGDQTPMSTKFELRDDRSVIRNYGMLLVKLCETVPDGIVAFFPSYAYMESIIAAWNELGILRKMEAFKLVFFETKDIVETTLSLNNYKRACDVGRGAVFLSIARGKVAEGIDFDRHYGRCVVIFGIPFQYTLSHVLRARLVYLRDTFHIREQDFLTFDAIRQTSQCIGRIIRSKRDYGVIVFADKRYASHDKRSKLPQWVLQFLPDAHINLTTEMGIHIARKFLKEMAQPVPDTLDRVKTLLTAEDIAALQGSGGGAGVAASGVRAIGLGLPPSSLLPGASSGIHSRGGSTGAGVGADAQALYHDDIIMDDGLVIDEAVAAAMDITLNELHQLQAAEALVDHPIGREGGVGVGSDGTATATATARIPPARAAPSGLFAFGDMPGAAEVASREALAGPGFLLGLSGAASNDTTGSSVVAGQQRPRDAMDESSTGT